ncbi:hypothetical protein F5B17DRAFT_79327 [Nemania serpens]|nr:hypothetical protein F5B17DRAFT_79327 [Nemania serpens]
MRDLGPLRLAAAGPLLALPRSYAKSCSALLSNGDNDSTPRRDDLRRCLRQRSINNGKTSETHHISRDNGRSWHMALKRPGLGLAITTKGPRTNREGDNYTDHLVLPLDLNLTREPCRLRAYVCVCTPSSCTGAAVLQRYT